MLNYVISKLNDPIWLTITCVIAIMLVYYIIQWIRSSRNHCDSADEYAKGCLETVGFGCFLPFTFIVIVAVAVAW